MHSIGATQIYSHWELCIRDDGSTNDGTREILSEYAKHDSRIKLRFSSNNEGIVHATNTALRIASGLFVALLDLVLGLGGVAGHWLRRFPGSLGYFNSLASTRNVSAVTAACMLLKRKVFDCVGGFGEQLTVGLSLPG